VDDCCCITLLPMVSRIQETIIAPQLLPSWWKLFQQV
jgi:hypothetical protein